MNDAANKRSKSRRGFSLIEAVIAVTLSVVVLATATKLLHKMFAHQQVSKAAARFHVATSQVAHRFRDDVHACEECVDDSGLRLKFADGSTVIYRVDTENESALIRERALEDTKTLDAFRFPKSCSIDTPRLVKPDGLNGNIAQLRIGLADPTIPTNVTREESATDVGVPRREMVIEAAVGTRKGNR